MTYENKPVARWRKMFKGQIFLVSCNQLGTEATKEGSWKAANAWWTAKRAELTKEVAVGSEGLKRQFVNAYAGKVVSDSELPVHFDAMVNAVASGFDKGQQSQFFAMLLGHEKYEALVQTVEAGKKADAMVDNLLHGEPAMQDTIDNHVKSWLELLNVQVQNGKLSAIM
jgi:hypothetical protein